jgi:hypothetical protein
MPDRAENSSSSEEWKANKMNKHWNGCTLPLQSEAQMRPSGTALLRGPGFELKVLHFAFPLTIIQSWQI